MGNIEKYKKYFTKEYFTKEYLMGPNSFKKCILTLTLCEGLSL